MIVTALEYKNRTLVLIARNPMQISKKKEKKSTVLNGSGIIYIIEN